MQTLNISQLEEGQRLDKYLKRYFKNASGSFLYKMLRKKNIVLNGKKADGTEIIKAGDTVNTFFSEETFSKFVGNDDEVTSVYENAYQNLKGIEVIFEDDDIVILNKPTGVVSQTDENNNYSINEWLIGYLINKGEAPDFSIYKPSSCNRLDRNTSGIILCAKSYKGSRYLSDAIKSRDFGKYYNAICEGILEDEKELKGYLYKDKNANKVRITNNKVEGSEPIHTIIKPISNNGRYTLLEVKLITGKSHQIRAHLSSIGHPLAGDIKYGGHPYNGIKHQLLHSSYVELSDGRIFKAKLPDYFRLT